MRRKTNGMRSIGSTSLHPATGSELALPVERDLISRVWGKSQKWW